MQRPILFAALLIATGAAAQEPPVAAHKDLWCGLAFDYAAGELPPDATPRQQQVIPHYAAGAAMLLERAEQGYRRAGYGAARFAALREQLRGEIESGLGTAAAPYSFQDCDLLLPR
ncbi:MAG TPA: hypothetical protein VGN80_16225 [Devosiaceae bacterium]|jgi:hypothetical protein|nr:hypothetical protein [Devosiaceae bacterium]